MTRCILVTGASSGIGLETCKILASSGYRVVMIARNEEKLKEVCASLPACTDGSSHAYFSFDFEKTEKIEEFLRDITAEYKIDGLVYCVGNSNTKRLKDLTIEELLPNMRSNFFSFVELVRVLISLRKGKAEQFNIVAVSSLAATHANTKYYTSYVASKAALEASIRVLASELVIKNCSVCAVKPGYVETPRIEGDKLMHPDLEDHIKKTGFQPGGFIPPSTVAKTIAMLIACDDLSFAGSMIPINAAAIA